jgi:Domain of unknown function (DUF4153)
VIPQTGMLFYAISLRIGQYGFTVNRYLVVAFGIWLIIISIYLILSRKKYLQIIVSILAIMLLIVSIGPWSAISVSYHNQWNRFITNLETAKILQNNIITPFKSKDDISQEFSAEIYSGIQYLCDFKNCEDIKILFKNELKDRVIGEVYSVFDREWTSKYEIVNHLQEKLKLYTYAGENKDIAADPSLNLYSSEKNNSDVIMIS